MMGEAGDCTSHGEFKINLKKLLKPNFCLVIQTQFLGWIMLCEAGQRQSNGSRG